MKLAIISNKDGESVEQMAKAYFGSLIHIAVGAREGVPLKPEPDMLRLAMRELRVEPERTLYIGDAPSDFHAAQNAGADCILARWGYGDPAALEPLSPLCFADDPAELPMLILREQEDLR
jgi:phosphoglycolate phosphatase